MESQTTADNGNQDVISINQDSLGIPATYFTPSGQSAPVSNALYPYWSGQISTGYVIGLVASNGAATLSVNFSDVPGLGAGTYSWKECYTGATGTGTSVSATLEANDMAIFKVAKSGGSVSTTSVKSTSTSSAQTTTTTSKAASSSTTTSSAAATATGGTLAKWSQCAGENWTGSGTCVAGTTCTYSNPYYSQCL
jgi:hypothetical protein